MVVESEALPPGVSPSPSQAPSAPFDSGAFVILSDSLPGATISTWLSACPDDPTQRSGHVECAPSAQGVTIFQQVRFTPLPSH